MRCNTTWLKQGAVLAVGLAVSLPAFGKGLPLLRNSADNDTAVTTVSTPVTIDVLANDTLARGKTVLKIAKKPRHGNAQVVGDRVLYTPNPGYTGDDSFNYMTVGLGRVGKGRVDVAMGVPFALAGTVTDAPVANAVVTATIGGFSYATVADANGNYTLDIIGTGRDMVVLGARGGPAQAAVNFLSVVGQFDRLLAESGGDGVLDRADNHQVQVTHVSTAEAFLLQAASQGGILTDQALQDARDALDPGALLRMAAAIKLVVDEGFALPAGANDVLEMISNPDLFDQFVTAAEVSNPGALDAATQATLADPAVTPAATAADYFGSYTLITELGAPGTIRVGIGQGDRLELAADGTGRYLNGALNADPSLSWAFIDNKVVAVFNNPVTFTSYPSIEGYGQIRQLVTRNSMTVTRLVDGGGRDIFGVTTNSHVSYPDHPELGEYDTSGTSSKLAIEDGAAGRPFRAGEFPMLRTFPVVREGHVNASGYSLFDFAAGGTGTRDDGEAFDWTLEEDGRLLVEYADGAWSRFTRLASDGRKADGIIAVHEWHGMMLAEWSISNTFDGSLLFTHPFLAKSWRSGFDTSQASLEPAMTSLFLTLDADGSSAMTSSYRGDPTIWTSPQHWILNAETGAMESTIYGDNSGFGVAPCTPPVNGCYVNVRRTWHPIAVDGNRIYVIEELSWDSDWDLDMDIQHQRGNFYDAEALPYEIPVHH